MTQQNTVLLCKIIFSSSFVSFSSTPSPPVLLLCSVSTNLFASLLPYLAELRWFPWNQEIKPPIEVFFWGGLALQVFITQSCFNSPSLTVPGSVYWPLSVQVWDIQSASAFFSLGLLLFPLTELLSALYIHLLVSLPTYAEKADEVSTPSSKQRK